jgi:hypothetical protein
MKYIPILLLLAGTARADDPPPPEPKPPEPPKPDLVTQELVGRINALEKRLKQVEGDLDQAKDDNKALGDQVSALLPLTTRFTGYVDIGFFGTTGNGAGTRSDTDHKYFPQYSYVPGSWVFWGDPLATAINSRGDPADTGDSRAVTFDAIHSRGNTSFLVNNVNFGIFAGIGDNATVNTSIDFVPRSRDVSNASGLFVGDYIDVKLAYGEWRPKIDAFPLALQIGKFDSVLGVEYRSLESPDRLGITPSLICRYTCGRPIGIKARAKFLSDNLIVNIAVTNGSHFSEGFPFSDETDTNQWKTTAARISYKIGGKLELGVSGAFGAQDDQPSDSVYQWHLGADAHLEVGDFEATAEYVHGIAKGETSQPTLTMPTAALPCDIAPCINYTGAYGLVGYHATNTVIPYARVDWRDALHQSGASFVYISKILRATAGVRFEIGTHLIVKAEYTTIHELNPGVPQIPDDVFTSSVIVKY